MSAFDFLVVPLPPVVPLISSLPAFGNSSSLAKQSPALTGLPELNLLGSCLRKAQGFGLSCPETAGMELSSESWKVDLDLFCWFLGLMGQSLTQSTPVTPSEGSWRAA